jgi:pyrroloquinoline quinone (PQQ) biosynthesis protein C
MQQLSILLGIAVLTIAILFFPEEVMASVMGQPHSLLFQRFELAVGLEDRSQRIVSSDEPGSRWASDFRALCEQGELVGVGALGLGTELIVSNIYSKILMGLRSVSSISQKDHVFFDLHSECDDEHAKQLLSIAVDLAVDSSAREQIEYGMKKALELRCQFWDHMHERSRMFSKERKRA